MIDRRVEEMETGEKIQREYGGVLLDGFDEWFESQRIKRFNIKTGLATLVVTAFVCVAVWRLTPYTQGFPGRPGLRHRTYGFHRKPVNSVTGA